MTKKLLAAALLLAAIGLNLTTPGILGYSNWTSSAPKGWYVIKPDMPPARGQLVVMEVPEEAAPYIYGRGWGRPGTPLIKTIGALPGDSVTIGDDGLYINGRYVGPVYDKDAEGLDLPRLRGTIVIKPGEFLPVSAYERSFDGRYFGPQPLASIKHIIVPLIIF